MEVFSHKIFQFPTDDLAEEMLVTGFSNEPLIFDDWKIMHHLCQVFGESPKNLPRHTPSCSILNRPEFDAARVHEGLTKDFGWKLTTTRLDSLCSGYLSHVVAFLNRPKGFLRGRCSLRRRLSACIPSHTTADLDSRRVHRGKEELLNAGRVNDPAQHGVQQSPIDYFRTAEKFEHFSPSGVLSFMHWL